MYFTLKKILLNTTNSRRFSICIVQSSFHTFQIDVSVEESCRQRNGINARSQNVFEESPNGLVIRRCDTLHRIVCNCLDGCWRSPRTAARSIITGTERACSTKTQRRKFVFVQYSIGVCGRSLFATRNINLF